MCPREHVWGAGMADFPSTQCAHWHTPVAAFHGACRVPEGDPVIIAALSQMWQSGANDVPWCRCLSHAVMHAHSSGAWVG